MARWARALAPTSGKTQPVTSPPQEASLQALTHLLPALPPWGRFYLEGSSLVLKGLRASDSGAYTCVAHNAAGEDARLHTVNVLGEQLRGEESQAAPPSQGGSSLAAVGPPLGHLEGGARARIREPW